MADADNARVFSEFKVCNACKRSLPRTPEFFGRTKVCSDGLIGKCKECTNAFYRQRREDMTPEQRKADNKRVNSKRDAERAARMALPKPPKVFSPVKKCPKCKEEKPRTTAFFSPDKNTADGLNSWCKKCNCHHAKEKRLSNLEEARARDRANYAANPERAKAASKKFNATEKGKANQRKGRKRRKDKYWLHDRMATAIRRLIGQGNGSSKWMEFVGYGIEELRAHLEKQFTKGMTWDLVKSGAIHIDHRIPIKNFPNANRKDHPDFLACWALTNLSPLWAQKNMSKGSKRFYLL